MRFARDGVLTRISQKIALCECIDQCISSSGWLPCSALR